MQHLLLTGEKDGGDLCYSSSGRAVHRMNLISVSSDPFELTDQSEGSREPVASRCPVIADKELGFLRGMLTGLEDCERGGSVP